jgi:transposase
MSYKVFCGLDVGKAEHHATALNLAGKRLYDKAIANDEAALRALFTQLGEPCELVVVVDQPASIGALPVAVAQAMGIAVEYLPGLSMRRIADLHPGNAKTDARDAYIIADAARTMPHALRSVDIAGPAMADLAVLVGHDDDLKDQVTAQTNRVRNLLLGVHPALERALGVNLAHPAVLALLSKYGGPTGLRKAGKTRIDTLLKKKAPRIHTRLTEAIWAALDAQTVTVAGTSSVEAILPGMAAGLASLIEQRAAVGAEVEKVLDAHPLAKVLTSMPAVGGLRPAHASWSRSPDGSSFPTAGHLASYAGLAPVTRRSGSSIRGEHPNRAGNRRLKNAMFMSAFSALRADPESRAYYDRKRAAGKKHNAALICLARRRCDVIFAMLRDGTYYAKQTASAA